MRNFAVIAKPLTVLLKKILCGFGVNHIRAFTTLKGQILIPPLAAAMREIGFVVSDCSVQWVDYRVIVYELIVYLVLLQI